MKKKDIKKLNGALLDGVEVPDGVLDAARDEMKSNAPETVSSPAPEGEILSGKAKNGSAVAINGKIVAVCCACAAFCLCVAIIIIMFVRPSANASDAAVYYIADLEKRQITSLSEYNGENDTAYIGVEFDGTLTYAYYDGEEAVLFLQVFAYEDIEYNWYVAVDESDGFDILSGYGGADGTAEIGGYTVYLSAAESVYARFYSGGSAYYLTGGADGTAVTDILKIILE